ncbi:MAG TPA: hypothetical protein VEK15_25945 [Vicinamibacteria bacterium]|nr:hypothetical protein [Vicinamibacteria bacterium]
MKAVVVALVAALLFSPGRTSNETPGNPCSGVLASGIPPRSKDAPTGSELMETVWNLRGRERDEAIVRELTQGNLPDFLRDLVPVRLWSRDRRGVFHEAIVCVTPDYLSVGSNDDFVRVPLGFQAAVDTAREFQFTLPTRKIVDAIYRQSSVRLAPRPMTPSPRMVSTPYFVEHNRIIEQQRSGELGELISGHKKDLILTKRLLTRKGRVAIYGWHEKAGHPIQPLSTFHGARYADYSHGVRLVSTTVMLDGSPRSVYDILRDSSVARVLTYEGAIRDAARLMRVEATPVKTPTD